jgi:ribosomal protein L16 Arg81 hydroxylase
MFLSGPHSHTNYHFDSSYVLAWQVHGRKRFCFTRDPERWCGPEVRRRLADRYDQMTRPAGLGAEDVVEVEMRPGDVLWNVMLTPHWVYSLDETAYSFNLTHFGLRCDGRLSPVGRELEDIHRERDAEEKRA